MGSSLGPHQDLRLCCQELQVTTQLLLLPLVHYYNHYWLHLVYCQEVKGVCTYVALLGQISDGKCYSVAIIAMVKSHRDKRIASDVSYSATDSES